MLLKKYSQNLNNHEPIITDIRTNYSLDYSALTGKVEEIRFYFQTSGCCKGDKIALFLENSIEYAVIVLALLDLDIVLVPLNVQLNKKKLLYLLTHSESRFLITSQSIIEKNVWLKDSGYRIILAEEIFRFVAPSNNYSLPKELLDHNDEALKFILYTSGTTGKPKGVMLSRGAVVKKISTLIDTLSLNSSGPFFSFLPLFSGHGMIPGMLVPLLSGCKVYLGKFDPFLVPQFWNIIAQYKINYFTSVPSILLLLKKHIHSAPPREKISLTDVFCASAPLPQDIYDWYYKHLGIKIRNCYGLTEAASWVSVSPALHRQPEASYVGKPLNCDIGVYDESGKKLTQGEKGEFWIKSSSNMHGYYKNEEETRETIVNGFIKTGDIGCIDKAGNIFILERRKHIVIRKGITIYPVEVDQIFLEHGHVEDAASFGIFDENYGEKLITSLVVHNKEKTKAEYFAYAREKLPAYLMPDDIFFMEVIPKGATGKVQLDCIKRQYLKFK